LRVIPGLYLNYESKILGTSAVIMFLVLWEFMGGALSIYNPIPVLRINPMFMSAPSLIFKAAVAMFSSREIYNDLKISSIEFFWGYILAVVVAIPFGIATGWYKRASYLFDPFVNAMNATPRVALLPLVRMDQVYKGHKIQASAWLSAGGWKPSAVVTYSEGGKHILKNVIIDQIFPTCVEAEQGGIDYVRKWIDDGKPERGL
jgi:ABC-type nitrate/sulfonate/bicarbonate transport system permease component